MSLAAWDLRDRSVARIRRNGGRCTPLPPREAREADAWNRAYLGPSPAMVRAVHFLRRHRLWARVARAWAMGPSEVAILAGVVAMAIAAWTVLS